MINQLKKNQVIALEEIIRKFKDLNKECKEDKSNFNNSFYNRTIILIHSLINVIEELKQKHTKEEITESLTQLKEIHALSPFIKRAQDWPCGYQGDYLTVEYICQQKNHAPKNSIGYYLECYALNSSITQQHRNKIAIQAHSILEKISSGQKNIQVLIFGCGSCFDLRSIQHGIKHYDNYQIILNDMDANALKFSKSKLDKAILARSKFINKNIISHVRELSRTKEQYDLVLFGGIFDYLSDKQISFVLKNIYNNTKEKGKILFTNIASNNPFKLWIEGIADWELIERKQEQNINICKLSSIPIQEIIQYKDGTGLTNIIEIVKGHNA